MNSKNLQHYFLLTELEMHEMIDQISESILIYENTVVIVDNRNRNAIINFEDEVVKLVGVFHLKSERFYISVAFVCIFIISISLDKVKHKFVELL